MTNPIRWGILGTGTIANKFAEDLRLLPEAQLIAVGSRSQENAAIFAHRFDIPHRHASYAALAKDPQVDCVYVATPHPFHHENALFCLHAGKAVLCEKPFTLNATQAMEVMEVARRKKLLLMEAMWTRCFPLLRKIRELVAQQTLGEIQLVTADFGFRAEFDPKSRLFDPHLGGGALLDVGIYPVSLASMILGEPQEILGTAAIGKSGVDEQASVTLRYAGGQLAILHTSIRATTFCEAAIVGTRGAIKIHSPFWQPSEMTLIVDGKADEVISMPFEGHGYHFEASEFMQCLRNGQLESPVVPLNETLSIMRTLDILRGQFGLKYPME
jgi:predicted dehydrogenase